MCDWKSHVQSCHLRVFPEQVVDTMFEKWMQEIGAMLPRMRSASVKTLTASWHTDARMGSLVIRPCLFRCGVPGATDTFRHYIGCPCLGALAEHGIVQTSNFYWLGLIVNPQWWKCSIGLAFGYLLYHSIRVESRPIESLFDFALAVGSRELGSMRRVAQLRLRA